MAITKTMHMKASGKGKIDVHLEHAINYILQPKKLGNANLTGGINCLPDAAYEQMKATKQMFGKTGGRQGYHFVISLKPGEGTPEEMYDIAMRFAEQAFGGEYEAIVAVHTDRNHLHAHIVINSVNMVTGYKFQYNNGDWKYKFQPITNRLCKEYGLHITPAEYSREPKNMERPQWEREQTFSKWIEQDVRFCALNAENMEHFIFLLEKQGFEVKQGEHIAVKVPGMKRFKRLDTISRDFSRENLEAVFKYEDASLVSPVNHTIPLMPVRKSIITPYQRKCYARMYRLRLAERKRFTYKLAYLYEQIRKMHELQEEYLVVVKYDVTSFADLVCLKFRLQRVGEELCKVQQDLYKEHGKQKRACKTEEDVAAFNASETEYHDKLEQIKFQKRDNHKKLQVVERCLERDASLTEAELEFRIPVGDMEKMAEVTEDNVPVNPYRGKESVIVSQATSKDITNGIAVDVEAGDMIDIGEVYDVNAVKIDTVEGDVCGYESINVREDKIIAIVEAARPNLQNAEQARLPSNKTDYTKMSVAEKVRCYPFNEKGTDSAFEMVKTYFETVGLGTDFHTVYEEARLLTEYYEKRNIEEFIQERTEQIKETMELLGIDAEKVSEYPPSVLAELFDFGNVEYFVGIKLFNRVIDRLGINMEQQRRYEVFDRIYTEGMQEEKDERGRSR